MMQQGEYRRAERYFRMALAEAREGFGPNDPHVAAACQNLAELYRVQRQYEQARPLYEQVWRFKQNQHHDMRMGCSRTSKLSQRRQSRSMSLTRTRKCAKTHTGSGGPAERVWRAGRAHSSRPAQRGR